MKILKEIPEEVNKKPIDFLKWLGDTSIIKTSEEENSEVIISCLVHGMEPSGYYATHKFLKKIKHEEIRLKKPVSFIFVNVKAALKKPYFTHRFLKDQMDMNRIWVDTGEFERQNFKVFKIKEHIINEKPKLLVDFHNTSAKNPAFIVSPTNNLNTIKLASTLVKNVIQIEWLGTLAKFASNYCDSFVLECGKYNSKKSHEMAYEALEKIMIYQDVMDGKINLGTEILISKNTQKITLPDYTSFNFSKQNTGEDIVLMPGIENYNFKELKTGTIIGWENKKGTIKSDFLEVKDGMIMTTDKEFMFNMLTDNTNIIRSDVLGYTTVFQKIRF